jgi:hypothetical protein
MVKNFAVFYETRKCITVQAEVFWVKMEAARSSEMLVSYRITTRRHSAKGFDLTFDLRGNPAPRMYYRV